MKAIRKRPGEPAEIIEVENTLKALQEEVGGYIETVTFSKDCAIICDEEGRLKGKPFNCNLLGVDFVGTILIIGVDGDAFCDLPQRATYWKGWGFEMANKNGRIYCEKIDSWCANGLDCDRVNCMNNKEKAPTGTAIPNVGANLNNQVQGNTVVVPCQGGKDV